MQEVAIIGAGELGGALAHRLARSDLAARIRLIDPTGHVAAGKALDIMHAAPIEAFSTSVSGSTDIAAATAARIIVIADRVAPADWSIDEALMVLKEIGSAAARSVIVCAGASHRELVERAVRDNGVPSRRIIGSAPEALASAVRALVALETNGSAKDVALTVLGVPPNAIVVPWDEATVAGFAATRMLDEPARRRLMARIGPLWPPGPYTLAAAGCEVLACVLGRSRRVVSCFVAADEGSGTRTRVGALPVRLDDRGVVVIERPLLDGSARVALENALAP